MSPAESERISSVYAGEQKRLLGYIRSRVRNKIEAEDIFQDVFYQLTLGFRDIRNIQSITAWLYRVADNRITDLFRKKKAVHVSYSDTVKETEEGPVSLSEILPALGSTPEDEELKEMMWETIWSVLSGLPSGQSRVFIENEFEEKSFKEISENTGIGINTLISRKRYAVLALRERLEVLYKLLKEK